MRPLAPLMSPIPPPVIPLSFMQPCQPGQVPFMMMSGPPRSGVPHFPASSSQPPVISSYQFAAKMRMSGLRPPAPGGSPGLRPQAGCGSSPRSPAQGGSTGIRPPAGRGNSPCPPVPKDSTNSPKCLAPGENTYLKPQTGGGNSSKPQVTGCNTKGEKTSDGGDGKTSSKSDNIKIDPSGEYKGGVGDGSAGERPVENDNKPEEPVRQDACGGGSQKGGSTGEVAQGTIKDDKLETGSGGNSKDESDLEPIDMDIDLNENSAIVQGDIQGEGSGRAGFTQIGKGMVEKPAFNQSLSSDRENGATRGGQLKRGGVMGRGAMRGGPTGREFDHSQYEEEDNESQPMGGGYNQSEYEEEGQRLMESDFCQSEYEEEADRLMGREFSQSQYEDEADRLMGNKFSQSQYEDADDGPPMRVGFTGSQKEAQWGGDQYNQVEGGYEYGDNEGGWGNTGSEQDMDYGWENQDGEQGYGFDDSSYNQGGPDFGSHSGPADRGYPGSSDQDSDLWQGPGFRSQSQGAGFNTKGRGRGGYGRGRDQQDPDAGQDMEYGSCDTSAENYNSGRGGDNFENREESSGGSGGYGERGGYGDPGFPQTTGVIGSRGSAVRGIGGRGRGRGGEAYYQEGEEEEESYYYNKCYICRMDFHEEQVSVYISYN